MNVRKHRRIRDRLVLRSLRAKFGILMAVLLVLGFGGAIGLLADRTARLHDVAPHDNSYPRRTIIGFPYFSLCGIGIPVLNRVRGFGRGLISRLAGGYTAYKAPATAA